MPDTIKFDINYDIYTNLPNDNTGIVGVTYGAGAPICGEELNEIQELTSRQISHYQSIISGLLGTAIADKDSVFYSSYAFNSTQYNNTSYQKYTCGKNGDGNIFLVYASKEIGANPKIIRANPSFVVPTAKSTYYVYIEMKEDREVTSSTSLYRNGYEGSFIIGNDNPMDGNDIVVVNNYIEHPVEKGSEVKHEVSRRCMITYRIIVSEVALDDARYVYFGRVENTTSSKKFIPVDEGRTFCVGGIRKKGNACFDLRIEADDWSWDDNKGAYIVSKNVENATDYRIVSPVIGLKLVWDGSNELDADTVSALQDAYSCIDKVEFDDNNKLTAYCYDDAPEETITLAIKVV